MPLLLAKPSCRVVRIKHWGIVTTRNSMDSAFGLPEGPTLLARSAFGQGHVFFCLVDIKAKDFFLVSTNVTHREALNNIAQSPKVDTFHAEAIEASGNQFPRIAGLLNRGSQSVSAGAQGGTGNQKFSPKGGWNVRQDGQPGLGTRTESNLFELVVSDQGVVIVHHTAQTKRGCCVCHRQMTG